MLLIETYVAPDAFGGRGLFSKNFVKKGTFIWQYNPECDRFYTLEEYANLGSAFNNHIHTYPTRINGVNGVMFNHCNDKYINHSETPNVGHFYSPISPEINSVDDVRCYPDIALEDILPGTELTTDYRKIILPGMSLGDYKHIKTGLNFLMDQFYPLEKVS